MEDLIGGHYGDAVEPWRFPDPILGLSFRAIGSRPRFHAVGSMGVPSGWAGGGRGPLRIFENFYLPTTLNPKKWTVFFCVPSVYTSNGRSDPILRLRFLMVGSHPRFHAVGTNIVVTTDWDHYGVRSEHSRGLTMVYDTENAAVDYERTPSGASYSGTTTPWPPTTSCTRSVRAATAA
jgi:hypothetical protein